MRTVKEWLDLYNSSDDSIALMIHEIQYDAYNQAIRDVAINAKTIKVANSGNWLDADIDYESILKLKK